VRRKAQNDKAGTATPPSLALSPSEQDARLGASGQDSIYQKIRLLDNKQRKLLQNLIDGMEPREACLAAGYGNSSGMRGLQDKMPDIMARLGLTDEILVEVYLKPLLVANETKFFANKGIVCDQKDVAALEVRRATLDMAFKLRGSYAETLRDVENAPTDSHDITVQIVNVGAQ
jgi:hypothetical protein